MTRYHVFGVVKHSQAKEKRDRPMSRVLTSDRLEKVGRKRGGGAFTSYERVLPPKKPMQNETGVLRRQPMVLVSSNSKKAYIEGCNST